MKNDGKKKIRKTDGPKKKGKTQKARVTRRRAREELEKAIEVHGRRINLDKTDYVGRWQIYIFSEGFKVGFRAGRKYESEQA